MDHPYLEQTLAFWLKEPTRDICTIIRFYMTAPPAPVMHLEQLGYMKVICEHCGIRFGADEIHRDGDVVFSGVTSIGSIKVARSARCIWCKLSATPYLWREDGWER
jgi:hypothetical protein